MSVEQNAAVTRRYFEELVSQGRFAVADELFTPTYGRNRPERFPQEVPPGPERAKFTWSTWRAAFPDWQTEIEDLLATDDRVAARVTAHGTHLGELRRPAVTLVPPTGKAVSITATVWLSFEGARIADL